MGIFSNASIKRNLTLIIMAISAVSVLLTTSAITLLGIYNLRQSMKDDLMVTASIVGDRNVAVLTFNDAEKAEENLKRECIAAFDKIGVESKVTAVGFNPGIDAGLANYGDTEARLRAQRERCIQQYALSNQVCEESESHIAANKQCMDQGVGPISSVREVRSNLTNLYNTGDRKFDSSWGALQNAKVILNKMREPTSAQAPSN